MAGTSGPSLAPFICIGNGGVINSSLVSGPGDQKGGLSGLQGESLLHFRCKAYRDSYSRARKGPM